MPRSRKPVFRHWFLFPGSLVLAVLLPGCSLVPPISPDSGRDRISPRAAAAAPHSVPGNAVKGSPFRPQAVSSTHRAALLEDGHEALLARVHLIREARHSIDLQTFIWTGDESGKLIIRDLIDAARRGVQVRLLVDHFGAHKGVDDVAFLSAVHPNLKLKVYRPPLKKLNASVWDQLVEMGVSLRDANQRMHNKVLVVDGSVLITGGRNYENTYFNHSTRMNFRDRDILVTGPVMSQVRSSFDDFWNYKHSIDCAQLHDVAVARQSPVRMKAVSDAHQQIPLYFRQVWSDAKGRSIRSLANRMRPVARIEWVADPPGKNRALHLWGSGSSTRRLREVVAGAEEEVIIQTPYLVLGRQSLRFFQSLRKKKPLLPIAISTNSFASTDNILAYGANYGLRDTYLGECRFEVYEMKSHPGDMMRILPQYPALFRQARRENRPEKEPFICLHSKTFVVDRKIAYVGSYNLDPRSGNLNTEAGVLIEDRRLAGRLRREILRDTEPQNSLVIAPRELPDSLRALNALTEDLSSKVLPIDLWPVKNATSFELKPGRNPVPYRHPDFYKNYEERGSFPGAVREGPLKEIVTRLFKVLGKPFTPLL